MPRIALFSIECAQLGDALTEIIERHRDEITVVVTSDVQSTARGGPIKQAAKNLRRSGPGFVKYLIYSFMLYPAVLAVDRAISPLRGGRRTRRSVRELCDAHGITHIRTGNVNSPEMVEALEAEELDFIVIYWFDQIIRQRVIALPSRGVINVHAALLPNCRGLFPTLFSAVEAGTPFGISAHVIDSEEIDAGPILAQRIAKPPPGRSVLFNDSWVNRVGVGMLDEVLSDFDALRGRARPQGEGSYYSFPDRRQLGLARRLGLRMAPLRDLVAVVRGTGAKDADALPPIRDLGAGEGMAPG
ncbi:formyltransferase family protein [Kitasatospora purpeofusca]|uniref:formyltransferase family protein n=1 Tax=Kitasatospora purpeofusca TaxID=67352 RepID=UPI002250596D|nr:formyltransferase family protein [Kitasatospora purpeofusca]MCX4690679.1 formyltransferase family protein [Kitasatospora purpeofusca]